MIGPPPPTVVPLLTTAELVRDALTERFPATAFSVETRRRARTSWIVVAWQGTPHVNAVRDVTKPFEGMRWYPTSRRRRRVIVRTRIDGVEGRLTYEPASVVLHQRPAP